jgi:hypothetical protein
MEITLLRKRPKIGHLSGPIETFQCIKSIRGFDVKIWKVFIYLHLENLDEVPVWFYALERFYRPWKWPIFGRFLTLFPLKRLGLREKNTSNMAGVRRWRHRVTSLQVLYLHFVIPKLGCSTWLYLGVTSLCLDTWMTNHNILVILITLASSNCMSPKK